MSKPMGPKVPARSLRESESLLRGAEAQEDKQHFWRGVRLFLLTLLAIGCLVATAVDIVLWVFR